MVAIPPLSRDSTLLAPSPLPALPPDPTELPFSYLPARYLVQIHPSHFRPRRLPESLGHPSHSKSWRLLYALWHLENAVDVVSGVDWATELTLNHSTRRLTRVSHRSEDLREGP